MVVLDGQDYLRYARLPAIVENLMAQGRIGPLALALVSHGRQARVVEYACSEATAGFILNTVLPMARSEMNVVDAPVAVLGASMGGLMALYLGITKPHAFNRVISQSGAFRASPVSYSDVLSDVILPNCPAPPIDIWMDIGTFEYLLPGNREIHEILVARGYHVEYREYSGGHNWTCWRNELEFALTAMFPAENRS